MSEKLRYVPDGALVEVTCRTVNGMLLLRPSKRVNEIVVGVVGRAQQRYGVAIHTIVFQSNHYHMTLTPGDARRLARFMNYVNSNVARKVGRLVGWRCRFWSRRYTAILVSDEEEAQVARLRYHLEHGAKENFVLSPLDWPGVHCARPLVDGSMTLEGFWFDDTKAYNARRRGESPGEYDFAVATQVALTPMPCWAHLDAAEYRERIAEMVRDIEETTLARHHRDESAPTGAQFVFQQDPLSRPRRSKYSPAPAVHAFRGVVRDLIREAYVLFVVAYREAAELLRKGVTDVRFPPGCFPPALPFVAS